MNPGGGARAWLAAFGPPGRVGGQLGTGASRIGRAGTTTSREAGRVLDLLEAPAEWSPAMIESAGSQIIFDGVLHNRAELAAQFTDSSHREPTDADLVDQAYRSWGEDAVRRLRGVFALVIADPARDLLLCARDQAGIHSLFYAELDRTILLSPSVETLLAHAEISADLDRATLVARLTGRWSTTDETYFARVRRVLPGHVMRISGNDRRAYRHWNPVSAGGAMAWIPDDEVPERFEALLAQAVDRCLALGPAGVYLSGGLDSSMLAMMATDLSGRRQGWSAPCALSLLFSLADLDETAIQRGLATQLGLPHVQLRFEDAAGPHGTLAAALEMTRTLPAPLALIWRPALQRLALHGREHGCRVILAGDGADEWLWENPILAADSLRSLDLRDVFRLWRLYSRSYHFSAADACRIVVWRSAVRPLLSDAWHSFAARCGAHQLVRRRWRSTAMKNAAWPRWVAPDPTLRAEVARRLEELAVRRWSASRTDSHYVRDTRWRLDVPEKWFLEEETFAVGRRAGVPVREPFWDPDLIEFLVRVHPRARSAGGLAKALVRRPLARRFPGLGFDRQRKSWMGAALQSVLLREAGAAGQALGGVRTLVDLGIVDGREVNTLPDDERLRWAWNLYNLEAWTRAHG